MSVIDYILVAVFLLGLLGLGMWLSRRAGQSTDEFILAGRNLPWWLAGASILATNLNASGMLQDSRKVRQDGIGGLWFTWRSIITACIASVFFTRLWRRAAFVTQMEFYQCRYAGPKASLARTYDTVVYGIISAPMWAAIGLVGMKKVASVLLGLPPTFVVMGMSLDTDIAVVTILVVITLVYSAASGVYGVVWTDLIEAVIAMVASYSLMFLVLAHVGGPTGLRDLVTGHDDGGRLLSLVPAAGAVFIFYVVFAIMEQGGYNPHIQRSLCVKDEREVIFTQLYSGVLNFAFKSWPYIVCGLAGLFLISDAYLLENFQPGLGPAGEPIPDHEMVFPALVRQFMPVGLMGLMAAGFLSAFMSSFDTNVHNSTAIFVNDLYRPYLVRGRDEHHYVAVSRWYMVVATVAASLVGILVNDILYLFMFLLAVLQSVGLVKLLRFIWWRSNVWGELAAQVSSLIISGLIIAGVFDEWVRSMVLASGLELDNDTFYVFRTATLVGVSTLVSVIAILVTPPEPMETLVGFYERVRPFGWWGPVRVEANAPDEASDSLPWLTALSLSMILIIFGTMFAFMGMLLAWSIVFWSSLPMAVGGIALFVVSIRRLYPKDAAP